MQVIDHGFFTEIRADEGMFLTDLDETMVVVAIVGINLNVNNYKDITPEEAQVIIERLMHENGEDGIESVENIDNI